MTLFVCICNTNTIAVQTKKTFHLTKHIISKLISFMLSIPDKKELHIVAKFSCTYNLEIIFFLQCLKI